LGEVTELNTGNGQLVCSFAGEDEREESRASEIREKKEASRLSRK